MIQKKKMNEIILKYYSAIEKTECEIWFDKLLNSLLQLCLIDI